MHPGETYTERPLKREILRLVAALEATGRTAQVRSYFDDQNPGLLSPDRDAAAITIGMGRDAEDGIKDVIDVVEQADNGPLEVTITGEFTADDDFLTLSNKDLKEGELFFGLPAALIVLLLVFGAVVAGLIPVLLAIVAIIFALALVAIVGQVWEVSFFVVNMLTGMGLALGVDYALFIVSRFREERAAATEKVEAIVATGADREPGRPLQRDGVRDRHDRDAARARHDPAQPRRRRDPRRADCGRCGDDPAAGGSLAARRPRRRAPAAVGRPRLRRGEVLGRGRRPRPAAAARVPPRLDRIPDPARPAGARPAHGLGGVRTIPDGYASKDGFNALERELGVGTVDTAQIVVVGDVAAPPVRRGSTGSAPSSPATTRSGTRSSRRRRTRRLAVVEALVAGDSRDERSVQAIERLRSELVPRSARRRRT